MRITVRISSAGKFWHPEWPKIDIDKIFPDVGNGEKKFDEAEFRRQMKDCRQVQIGGCDSGTPLAFGAVLIASVRDWLEKNHRDRDVKSKRIDARLSHKIVNDTVSFCRVNVTGVVRSWKVGSATAVARVAKVRITTDDRGIVQPERYDRQFAMIVADFCRCYSNSYVRRGEPPLVFDGETETLLKDLNELSTADQKEVNR